MNTTCWFKLHPALFSIRRGEHIGRQWQRKARTPLSLDYRRPYKLFPWCICPPDNILEMLSRPITFLKCKNVIEKRIGLYRLSTRSGGQRPKCSSKMLQMPAMDGKKAKA